MTDNEMKLSEAEIIKALECCGNMNDCKKECPLDDLGGIDKCLPTLTLNALDIIKRQRDEIERLETECEKAYKQAEADILGNLADGGTSCHWCIDKHKAEAIKEFAQRLKENIDNGELYSISEDYEMTVDHINNLVKEMTEDNNAT